MLLSLCSNTSSSRSDTSGGVRPSGPLMSASANMTACEKGSLWDQQSAGTQ